MLRATYPATPQGPDTTWLDGHMIVAVPICIALAWLIVATINGVLARRYGGQR